MVVVKKKVTNKKQDEWTPSNPYRTHMTIGDKELYAVRFHNKKKEGYDRDDIRKFIQDKSNELKSKYGDVKVSNAIKYSNLNWRGSGFDNAGEAVRVYNPNDYNDIEDPGEITDFEIQFTIKK